MASKLCMNALCGASTSSVWRKGWGLRSGEFANLCDKCGLAYEQSIFCEVYHSKDSGWRECKSCGKRLHCGCIASRLLVELLDNGGINCLNCSRTSGANTVGADKTPNGFVKSRIDDIAELQSLSAENGMDKFMHLVNSTERMGEKRLLQLHGDGIDASFRQLKQQLIFPKMGETGSTSFSHFDQGSSIFSQSNKAEIGKATSGAKNLYGSIATNLSIALGSHLGNSTPFGTVVDERSQSKTPPLPGSSSRHLLPKPPKSNLATGMEPNNIMVTPVRIARPPAEGRGRSLMLPRYWPRITDQELQQISMDPNSTILPLFEKVLSASDAGRIGRLVLPKACAEAYFPPISQPEGIPLRIQDVKGKEWVFQFRFWPNNNSRMYVLEGVTPCIQSMQLEAGDTVIFARMDPEGKLVMGFRKASNSFIVQGSNDAHLTAMSKQLPSANGDISWHKSEKQEDMTREGLMQPSTRVPEKKRSRNIGTKGKRLSMDSRDSLELKVTWEEAQDLLRPAPTSKPNIVTIDDHEFEEYDEPPVFGKRSIFVAHSTGRQEQWAECDSCSKWRRLPVDVLLPPKWTCTENVWDQSRSSCSAPNELTPKELENLLRQNKDHKKRRLTSSQGPARESESSALDALANAAILGDVGEQGTATVATTTKHPRHRPGCSCIVCIQPPSGKGRHKPTCTCNVCNTVKRRFETLMKRKRKRLSDREAEIALRNQQQWDSKDETTAEVETSSKSKRRKLTEKSAVENGKGQIDLNFHPDREEDSQAAGGANQMTMMNLLQVASLSAETYAKQNGSTSLASEQETGSTSHVASQGGGGEDSEGQVPVDRKLDSALEEQESDGEENNQPITVE
ncbi:B3 domain-containing transcription repressor VAL2 [Linum perenne]